MPSNISDLVEIIGKETTETRGKSGKYTAEDRLFAVTSYFLTQSMRKVSAQTGISEDTLGRWKNSEWWPIVYNEVKLAKNDELDGKLTSIIDQATVLVAERLKTGDAILGKDGELVFKPVSARDAATTLAILFDKRELIRGSSGAVSTPETTDKLLKKLHDTFTTLAKVVKPDLKTIEGAFTVEGTSE